MRHHVTNRGSGTRRSKTPALARVMANSVVSFEEALASIDVAHLINLNTSLI